MTNPFDIIIFICPFPLFDGQRRIYTFKDTCQKDNSILLDNGMSKIFLRTKGSLNDVSPAVKNFLDFVDGLPVQDSWVDEIRDLIVKLKNTEKEKVNYMTYQMKIAEEREEARAEGQREERKVGIKALIASAKALAATPAQTAEQLVKLYSLSKDEAHAAVQANWYAR